MILQATSAILRAWRAGKRRQTLELMLPTPTAGGPRTPGDLSWPGGIRQQFRAARPLVEQLLRRLRGQAGLEVRHQCLTLQHCKTQKPSMARRHPAAIPARPTAGGAAAAQAARAGWLGDESLKTPFIQLQEYSKQSWQAVSEHNRCSRWQISCYLRMRGQTVSLARRSSSKLDLLYIVSSPTH